MPLGPGVRYRVKTTTGGKRVRLAFKGRTVIEAKNIDTGAVHSPSEFAADRAKSRMGRRLTAMRGVRARFVGPEEGV